MAQRGLHHSSCSHERSWRSAKEGGQKAQSFGRSRGGFSTKIHVKMDALGLPLKLYLTGGNRGDRIGVWELLEPEDACAQALLADRAYDANALRDKLEQAQIQAVIPCNPNCRQIPYDKEIYKARHVVECLINKIKWFRRVATRYDKLDLTWPVASFGFGSKFPYVNGT